MLPPWPSNQQWKVPQNHRHTDNVSAARKTNTHTHTHTQRHGGGILAPMGAEPIRQSSPRILLTCRHCSANHYRLNILINMYTVCRDASKGNKGDYAAMIRTCHTYLSYHWPALLPHSTQHREQAPQTGSHSNTRTPVYRCLYWR